MLFAPELVGMFLTQSAHDGDRSQLRLLGEPVLNRNNMRVELGRHANPRFITSLGSPMRRTRIAGLGRRAVLAKATASGADDCIPARGARRSRVSSGKGAKGSAAANDAGISEAARHRIFKWCRPDAAMPPGGVISTP
jgi:hypothetical protein